MIEITVPENTLSADGVLKDLASTGVRKGISKIRATDSTGNTIEYVITNVTDSVFAELTPQVVASIVALGGKVVNYPHFVRMTSEFANANTVPAYVPESTYVDANENEVAYTWANFPDVQTVTVEGVDYVTREGTDGNYYWSGTVIGSLLADGYTVLTPNEFVAWRPEE